ncbi:MAG: DUF6538 domain-containing protein [Sulfitobacter sp.]
MGKQSYLLRRGGSYSARIRVPADLVDIVGRQQLVKSLGTRDPSEARRLVLTVVSDWHDQFERLRSRIKLTSEEATDAALDFPS